MALIKKRSSAQTEFHNDPPQSEKSFDDLAFELLEDDISLRRWAARDLTIFGHDAVSILLSALAQELDHVVQEAILDALESISGERVVNGLLPMLRSENASLRNGVISVLQSMPESVALHIIDLLNDSASDVRIFAIDILQILAHSDTPMWLLSVLQDETHVNVLATAVDRLAEVGTPEMIDDLLALKVRFPNEAYLHFAIDIAVDRIKIT